MNYGENYVKVATLSHHSNHIQNLCFSPDSKFLLSASDDKTAILWNSQNAKVVTVIRSHSNTVRDCCFTDDGNFMVTGSTDSNVILHDAKTFQEVIAFSCFSRLCALDSAHVNFKTMIACGDGSGVLYILTPVGLKI